MLQLFKYPRRPLKQVCWQWRRVYGLARFSSDTEISTVKPSDEELLARHLQYRSNLKKYYWDYIYITPEEREERRKEIPQLTQKYPKMELTDVIIDFVKDAGEPVIFRAIWNHIQSIPKYQIYMVKRNTVRIHVYTLTRDKILKRISGKPNYKFIIFPTEQASESPEATTEAKS